MTSIIAFAPQYNTGKKHDATGAFQPEAEAFCAFRKSGAVFLVNNRLAPQAMRAEVLYLLRPPCFNFAFFCHGRTKGIQFGFGTSNVDELAKAIAAACKPISDPRIALYCCNTAGGPGVGGDGGFADLLRDALCRAGAVNCQVDAHVGRGHTTERPYVRRFEGKGSPVGGVGGYFLVAPGSKLWRPWVKAMKDEKGTLRYEFPFMAVDALHNRLMGG